MEPFRAWFSRQDKGTKALIPAHSTFWLDDAWMIGDDSLPCGLLLSTSDQAATIARINAERVAHKLDVIPAWGPDELRPYYGDVLTIIPPQQLALAVFQLCRDATSNVAAGVRAGELTIAARLANLGTTAPLSTAALLALLMAREAVGKSLFTCTQDELIAVNDTTGKLLLAMGLANGPLDADQLPKPPAGHDGGGGDRGYL